MDKNTVTFKYKDYRIEGAGRYKAMTLNTNEFIRRFLMHVLPKRFHRIRHYGLLANGNRVTNIAKARELLSVSDLNAEAPLSDDEGSRKPDASPHPCPSCGGRMIIISRNNR